MEAIAMGQIAIATDGGGMSKLIEDNVNGFLIPPGRPELIAEKIKMISKMDDRLSNISKRAIHTIKTKFSNERMAREHKTVCQNLMEGK